MVREPVLVAGIEAMCECCTADLSHDEKAVIVLHVPDCWTQVLCDDCWRTLQVAAAKQLSRQVLHDADSPQDLRETAERVLAKIQAL